MAIMADFCARRGRLTPGPGQARRQTPRRYRAGREDWLVDEHADQETTLAASEEFGGRRKALASALSALNNRERRIFEARPACRRADHAQGTSRRVRHLARAREPNRRVCLREGAEVGEEARRCDGNSGASAGAF